MSDYTKLNDVDIEDVTLYRAYASTVEPKGIKDLVKHISIYEDIHSPFISGYVYISDAVGLRSSFPIVGQEYLVVKFKTPDSDLPFTSENFSNEFWFSVTSISDRTKAVGDRSEMYRLNFVDLHSNYDQQSRVRNASSYFHQPDQAMSISDMVQILEIDYFGGNLRNEFVHEQTEGWEPPKDQWGNPLAGMDFETTKNNYKFIYPSLSPTDTIRWLSTMAVSNTPPHHANYSFWQSVDKRYHFRSLGSLAEQDKTKTYYLRPSGLRTSLEEQRYFIQDYELSKEFNVAEDVSNGLYGSSLWTHDITTKEVSSIDWVYGQETFSETGHVETNLVNSIPPASVGRRGAGAFWAGPEYLKPKQSELSMAGTTPEDLYKYTTMTGFSNSDPEEWFQKRKSSMGFWGNSVVNIRVAGDSTLRVGQVVEINIPRTDVRVTIAETAYDRLESGRYLITGVRHVIVSTDVPEYTCQLELSRDSLPASVQPMWDLPPLRDIEKSLNDKRNRTTQEQDFLA